MQERCDEIREEEQNFKLITTLYFDGHKDPTQTLLQGPNCKPYRLVQLEEQSTVVENTSVGYV